MFRPVANGFLARDNCPNFDMTMIRGMRPEYNFLSDNGGRNHSKILFFYACRNI